MKIRITSLLSLFVCTLFFSHTGGAQDFELISAFQVSGEQEDKYTFIQESKQMAKKRVALSEIAKILGPDLFKKNKTQVIQKILPEINKFIHIEKTNSLNFSPPLSKVSFDIKIYKSILAKVLKSKGMFYTKRDNVVVLPLIAFKDEKNFKDYYWWKSGSPYSSRIGRKISKDFFAYFAKELKSKNFKFLRPIEKRFGKKVREDQRFMKLSEKDFRALGRQFGANVLLVGTISSSGKSSESIGIDKSQLKYNLKWVQTTENAQELPGVTIDFPTGAGSFESATWIKYLETKRGVGKELVANLFDSWQNGQVGSQTFTITLRGKFKYDQYKRLKQDIRKKIGAVSSLTEKSFTSSGVTLKLSASTSRKEILKKLQAHSKGKNDLQVTNSKSGEIILTFGSQQ